MPSKNVLNILIADPHAVTRAGIAAALNTKGQSHTFYEVATAHEAITYTARHKPHICIIEVNMPDMNGLIAAHQMLGQANTPTRVIVLTAVSADSEMERASQIGVHGWMDKNSPITKLPEAVAKVRSGQQWFDEPFQRHLGNYAEVPGYGKGEISKLTDRELTVAVFASNGRTNQQIGEIMGISDRTVTTHRDHIMKKLGVKNASELTKYCISAGWIKA